VKHEIFRGRDGLRKAADVASERIAALAEPTLIGWITGHERPPGWVLDEVTAQRRAMVTALRHAPSASPPHLKLDPPFPDVLGDGGIGLRGYAEQEAVWTQKYQFDRRRGRFGQITPAARRACPVLGDDETEWDTGMDDHRNAWASLSPDQRVWEILQTSSAPGTSRHHWGTDLDLFDDTPALWAPGQVLADAYTWLVSNAAFYGFVQPFMPPRSRETMCYAEERWHWSYFPVAHALMEWTRAHLGALTEALNGGWGRHEHYAFVTRHWRDFVFNVNESACP
jgi:hypothetical protein